MSAVSLPLRNNLVPFDRQLKAYNDAISRESARVEQSVTTAVDNLFHNSNSPFPARHWAVREADYDDPTSFDDNFLSTAEIETLTAALNLNGDDAQNVSTRTTFGGRSAVIGRENLDVLALIVKAAEAISRGYESVMGSPFRLNHRQFSMFQEMIQASLGQMFGYAELARCLDAIRAILPLDSGMSKYHAYILPRRFGKTVVASFFTAVMLACRNCFNCISVNTSQKLADDRLGNVMTFLAALIADPQHEITCSFQKSKNLLRVKSHWGTETRLVVTPRLDKEATIRPFSTFLVSYPTPNPPVLSPLLETNKTRTKLLHKRSLHFSPNFSCHPSIFCRGPPMPFS